MEAEQEDRPVPSHLVKEMFGEMVRLKKQMKLIKEILEVEDEKDDTITSTVDDDRV